MDSVLAKLVEYVHAVDAAALPASVVHEVVRHVVDTVGCGAGGVSSRPARIVRAVVGGTGGPMLASAYGVAEPILVDSAAFANATANRYLDFNDFGWSGHPSDMIPAVLGVAEAAGASGLDAIAGVHIAYEIATRLAEAVPATGGWDQGIFSSLGVAGALAHVLRFDREATAHALALAITPSLPLKVTRYGELSEWKAAAVPHASMTAILAARLAQAGMTGPPAPFEGRCGLFDQAWPQFDLGEFGGDGPSGIERSSLKRYGACYWGQVAIDIAVRMRAEAPSERVASIEIASTDAVVRTIGGAMGDHEEKWRPATRETADHSMPYLVASAWLDGGIDEATFATARLQDSRLHSLMDRISVSVGADETARATRDRSPTRMRVTLDDGTVLDRAQEVPSGHPDDPMSDAEVAAKFDGFVARVLPADAAAELSDRLWQLAGAHGLVEIGALFRRFDLDGPAR